jgi:hypothetical protein
MIGESAPPGFGRRSADPSPPESIVPAVEDLRVGENRRIASRSRTLLAGKIIIGEGLISPDCVIRDLSSSGARVRISAETDLPPTVRLLVIKEGLLFEANVAWRRDDQTGLVFVGQCDLRSDVDPARSGVRALWAQLTDR